jgi:glycosyltransferase involved in cell wall biosynthesis
VGTSNAGTVYYRMYTFARNMSSKNTQVKISGYDPASQNCVNWDAIIKSSWGSRDQLRMLAEDSDIIIFQAINKTMTLGLAHAFRKLFKIPVLMEIDDYILNVPGYNTAFSSYKADSERVRNNITQMKEASGMIVSTPYLKKQYQQFNKNIHVIPNGIDFKDWRYIRPQEHKKIRIGWMGSSAHTDDLESIKEPLMKILELPNVEFICVGGVPNSFKNYSKIKCYPKWATIDTYPQWVASLDFDIGLFPLVDNHFNKAKSNLRWLEYSALKIPTVASNVLPCKTIKHNKTGLICKNEKDWYNNIKYLIDNEKERKRLGENAYKEVKKNYNTEKIAKKYLRLLKKIKKGHKQ